MTTNSRRYHVGIIGGGPAGLSAALVLTRARRRVVVLDADPPRNASSPAVGGLLSRDGTPPMELRALAREQIARYGSVDFRQLSARDVIEAAGGFEIATDDGPALECDTILVAIGVRDQLPPILGAEQLWGRTVIHCAFCHGWENAGREWGVLATQPAHLQDALTYRNWTDEVMVIATPALPLPSDIRDALDGAGVAVVRGAIEAVEASPAGELQTIRMADGRRLPCGTLVVKPAQRQPALVHTLGLELDGDGRVRIDSESQTNRLGVFAAGDLAPGAQSVAAAIASGSVAAMNIIKRAGVPARVGAVQRLAARGRRRPQAAGRS